MAIAGLAIACLILYFSRPAGLLLNVGFAIFKVLLLIAVSIAGFVALKTNRSDSIGDQAKEWQPNDPQKDPVRELGAFISVLFAYQGWQNANYVRQLYSDPIEFHLLQGFSLTQGRLLERSRG